LKIAIYDTEHQETVATLITLLTGENELHVFTSMQMGAELRQQFQGKNIHWFLFQNDKALDIPGAIKKQNKLVRFDHIFLNTVHKHHLLFARAAKSKSKLIVTVHEASNLSPKLKPGFRSIARFAGLKMLNRYADAFLVLSSEVKKHILKERLTKKPVIVLPAVVNATVVSGPADGNFIVCIPGTIDESRKDYSRLKELVTLISSSKRKISIVLLGAAKGKSWISEKTADIQNKYPSVDVHLFDADHIPQQQFDHWLSRSHLVWLPLTESVQREHGIEKYGRTKISGGFFDAVRAGKFMLHPDTIPVAEELKLQTQTYGSIQELADFILRAANDPNTYHSLESRVKENAGNFDLEKGRAALLDALKKL
jgi:hypothetical protein